MAGSGSAFADRFTGCLLGMAIGDALGVPGAYRDVNDASNGSDSLSYKARLAPDGRVDVPSGQFSINTELALCLLETLATSNGFIEPELAMYRFENAVSQTSYLVEPRERESIAHGCEHEDFQSGGRGASTGYAGPAVRSIPIALVHSFSDLNVSLVTREAMRATLLTDGDPQVVNGALAVAHAVRLVLRHDVPLEILTGEILSMIDEDEVASRLRGELPPERPEHVSDVVATAVHAVVRTGGDFEQSVNTVLRLGGATHLTGAIAGALCGAHVGAGSLPQELIDGLDGRAYILMAAPALLRTAQMRAGLVFQLHLQ